MTKNSEKLEWQEKLILRSMGRYGYLKFPRAFVERFQHNKDKLPDPEAFLQDDGDKVRLEFVWSKEDLPTVGE